MAVGQLYAFGETEPFLPTGSLGVIPTLNLRFPGQDYDIESASQYNWHRYYRSSIGRYISSDPIGLVGGTNTYNYAELRPLLLTDIMG